MRAEQRVSGPRRHQLAVSTAFRVPCERSHVDEDVRGGDDDLATVGHPGNVGLKLGALVRVSVRRIKFAIASAYPYQPEFALAHARLTAAAR
jgi:hypothetical protein